MVTMIADAVKVTVNHGCSTSDQWCFDSDNSDCYDCKKILINANKYWLMIMDSVGSNSFYATLILPLLYFLLVLLSPATKWKPSNTLQDWYEVEEYWHCGRFSKASIYKGVILIVSIAGLSAGISSSLFPDLVMQNIAYPVFQILFVLYGAFQVSTATYANVSVSRDGNNEAADRKMELRKALSNFPLDDINISMIEMIFKPTHVLLAMGETCAATSRINMTASTTVELDAHTKTLRSGANVDPVVAT